MYWYNKNKGKDEPTIIWDDGTKEWWDSNRRHRVNGPAIEWCNGNKEWWFNGKRHREDGPAVEKNNGTTVWFKNGEHHREDGPAVIWEDGTKEWYINGDRHRIDGPAFIEVVSNDRGYSNNIGKWWINGEEIGEEDHPFNVFRKKHKLPKNINKWPTEFQSLFYLTYA